MQRLKTTTGKYIDSFDSSRIYYEISKQKSDKTLIFLHGLGGNLTAWDKEVNHFNNIGVSTIAMDLRGHGFSQRHIDESSYKMDNFAKDVIGIIKAENIVNPVLVGHCFGGMISIITEGSYPKTANGLILIDTSYRPPVFVENIRDNIFIRYMFKVITKHIPEIGLEGYEDFDKFIGTGEFNVPRLIDDILHTSLRSYMLVCESLMSYDALELLSKIKIPTLVVDGTKDTFFPPAMAKELSDRIKKSKLDLVKGENHILVINNPNSITREISGFLESL